MQLTLFSDYALRVGLYLASHPDRLVSAAEVSRAYSISNAHLVKVVQRLTGLGLVQAVRGRGGGLRLARPPEAIGVGALLRATEPHFDLVECFDRRSNTCPIAPACGLKGALERAEQAFLEVLDRYTLADFVARPDRLVSLWDARLRRARRA
jgi:Rrf2 family transcriptional regulator, nitric oxide-sensitive transcriptional repressor